jgi:hypothetical protein
VYPASSNDPSWFVKSVPKLSLATCDVGLRIVNGDVLDEAVDLIGILREAVGDDGAVGDANVGVRANEVNAARWRDCLNLEYCNGISFNRTESMDRSRGKGGPIHAIRRL